MLPGPGCPIRESSGQRLFASSPKLIAGSYALHRLLTPRHPPCALLYLIHQCLRPCARRRALGHSVYHHPYSRCQRGRAGSLTGPLEGGPVRSRRTLKNRQQRSSSPSQLWTQPRLMDTGARVAPSLVRCPFWLLKGGDPAAGSPTATLLRLHPNHRPDRWRLPPLRVE